MGNAYASIGANLAQGISQGIQDSKMKKEQEKQYKDVIAAAKPWLDAIGTLAPQKPGDSPSRADLAGGIGSMQPGMPAQHEAHQANPFIRLQAMGEMLNDSEIPLSQRAAMAQQISGMAQTVVSEGYKNLMAPQKMVKDIDFGKIISLSTDDKGHVNLKDAFAILDGMGGAETEDYNALRIAVEASQKPAVAEEDKSLKSPTVFISPNGDIATYGLAKDGQWTRRYTDKDGNVVSETKPDDWVSMDAAKSGAMTGEQFIGQAEELRLIESGLLQLDEFRESREGAGTGVDFAKNYLGAQFKTLLGGKKKLTESERDAVVAKGTLRALVGKFRIDTVGPGIMTEEDARRIEDALGGAMVTGNMEKVNIMLDKLVRDAKSRAALLRTNLEASQKINPQLGMYNLPDPYVQGDTSGDAEFEYDPDTDTLQKVN
jgi:hypothetical protein